MVSKTRRHPRLRTALIIMGAAILLSHAIFWPLVWPTTPDIELPEAAPITIDDNGIWRTANSSLERRDGYWFFVHRGNAAELGANHAALGEFLVQRVEDAMFAEFKDLLPLPVQLLLPPVLLWQYRHMWDHLPQEQMEELWSFAETYADRHSFPFNSYQRGLYYHALHDITQELVGNPWVDPSIAGACTGFAATGKATRDGHLILGRNFDFEVFPLFDKEKVVHLFARDGAIPVLSVSWMAMFGVVSGMNAEGVWVSLNAARSEGRNRKGPPVALLVRTILEKARTIDEAASILEAIDPLVTDIYLIGDGKTGEVAAFERGTNRMARRDPVDGKLSVSNHLLTDTFAGDEGDLGLRTHSSTLARGLRMDQLVSAEPLSVERGLAILRDRLGPEGRPLAPGNRNAIDALIATHSVVADVTDRLLWVSTAPQTQGPYRVIDLLEELDRAGIDSRPYRASLPEGSRAWEVDALAQSDSQPVPAGDDGNRGLHEESVSRQPQDLPPGSLASTGEYERVERYRSFLADAENYLNDDKTGLALDMAPLYPLSAEATRLQGQALRMEGREKEAEQAFHRYLEQYPPFGPNYNKVVTWLEERQALPEVERSDLDGLR